jgi:hypothetical protein
MILASTVHTTGINWESVSVISGILSVVIGGCTKWIITSFRNARAEERAITLAQVKLITDSSLAQVKLMTDAMETRLNTVDTHLSQQDINVAQQGKDLARIEGRLAERIKE